MNQNQTPPQIIEARIKLHRAGIPHVYFRGCIFVLNIPNCLAVIMPIGDGIKLETKFVDYANENDLRQLKLDAHNKIYAALSATRELPEFEEVKGGEL
jgi:hypothetical protein